MVLFFRIEFPSISEIKSVSLIYWFGGVFGAIFVVGLIVISRKIGYASLFAFVITGQIFMSLVLDYLNRAGNAADAPSIYKILGVLVTLAGVIMIVKG